VTDDRTCDACGERKSRYPVDQTTQSVTVGGASGSFRVGQNGISVGASDGDSRSTTVDHERLCDSVACPKGRDTLDTALDQLEGQVRNVVEVPEKRWSDVGVHRTEAARQAIDEVQRAARELRNGDGPGDLDPEQVERILPDGVDEALARGRPGRVREAVYGVVGTEGQNRLEEIETVVSQAARTREHLEAVRERREERDRTASAWERHRSHERSEGYDRSR
jgi:hypothetical protein